MDCCALADPLCSPSRAAILTGTFPHNHGLTDNSRLNTSTFHPVAESRSVNTWLQKAGYDTMLAGKYMNGYHSGKGPDHWARYVPPGWSSFYGFQTVDFFGTAVNVNGVTKVYPKADYQTDIIANISLAWMRETYNQTKPFFMFITPHAPHAPYTPAPRHKGTLAGLKQPVDPAFNLPDALQQLLPGNLAHLPVVNASQMDTIYESRAEALLAIDEMIGHLLDEVSALGVEDNTYFFFTCDSACSAAQHQSQQTHVIACTLALPGTGTSVPCLHPPACHQTLRRVGSQLRTSNSDCWRWRAMIIRRLSSGSASHAARQARGLPTRYQRSLHRLWPGHHTESDHRRDGCKLRLCRHVGGARWRDTLRLSSTDGRQVSGAADAGQGKDDPHLHAAGGLPVLRGRAW